MITVAQHICPRCDLEVAITAANQWFQDIQTPRDCLCGLRWYLTTVGLQLSDRISIVFNTSEKAKEPNTTTIKRLHEAPKTPKPSSGIAAGPVGPPMGASSSYGVTGFGGFSGTAYLDPPADTFTFDELRWKITEDEANELMDRVHKLRLFQ